MTDTNANIPGASPLVDSNGQITPVWYQFLLAIFNRTGGSGTPPDITGLQQQVDAQEVEINSTSIAIPPPSNAITYRPSSNIFRSVESKLREAVSVKDFGAKGDGVTDDTAAFTAALAAYPAVYAPAGNYIIAGSITINAAPRMLFGDGPFATVFTSTNANLPTVSIPHASLPGIILKDFSINRTVPATVGGDGIVWTLVGDYGLISNVLVQRCYVGFHLGIIGFGTIENCRAEFNLSDGFQQTPVGVPSQWNFNNCLSQMNAGNGFAIIPTGTGPISVGTYTNINTFGNTGKGFAALGTPTAPIFGIRLIGGFFGQDGTHEVFLDTYGGSHRINGLYTELAGTSATGPGLPFGGGTPASNNGSGFFLTANNADVVLANVTAATHSHSGITTIAAKTIITGPSCTGNGIAGVAGDQNGIFGQGTAAYLIVSGGSCSNISGTAYQQFGLAVNDGTNFAATGVDLSGNLSGPYAIGTNIALATLSGNLGGDTRIPTGGLVVGNATGGSGGAGTINVSSAVDLNGIAYPSATPTTAYTPVVTATSGTFGSASATGSYYVIGKTVHFEVTVTITTVGTATVNPIVTLPFATSSTSGVQTFQGVERALTGKMLQGFVIANTTALTIRNYDTTTVIAAGAVLAMSGSYITN